MKIITTITFFFTVLLSSCTHYYYAPSVQNVPLFREKNEYRFAVVSGEGEEFSSTEFQTAYSVTNNIACMANLMSENGGSDTTNNWAKGIYIDGAIGYYKPLGKFGVMEIYGGVGSSNQHHQYGNKKDNNGSSDLTFTKLFLQPSIGLTFKLFDITLSTRICRLDFNKINYQVATNNSDSHEVDIIGNEVDFIANNNTSYLFESAFTIRGGWKYTKVQFLFLATNNFTNPNLPFEKSNFSIGIYFAIANRYWIKKLKKT